MGVGIVPMQFANEGAKVDAVEINPAVVPVAEEFFDFDSTSSIRPGKYPAVAPVELNVDPIHAFTSLSACGV